MVNEIKPIDQKNELIKFVDDMTLEVPETNGSDTSNIEVNNIIKLSETNRMPLNMGKPGKSSYMVTAMNLYQIEYQRLKEKPG